MCIPPDVLQFIAWLFLLPTVTNAANSFGCPLILKEKMQFISKHKKIGKGAETVANVNCTWNSANKIHNLVSLKTWGICCCNFYTSTYVCPFYITPVCAMSWITDSVMGIVYRVVTKFSWAKVRYIKRYKAAITRRIDRFKQTDR